MSASGFPVSADGVLISDGGLATELEARGHDLSDDLWSARLLADAPKEIVAVHAAFLRAGSQIATTASYQASFEGFARRGIDRAEAERLMRRSVELAKTARDASSTPAWVAASVGPYGAMLAHGEEYIGRYGLSVAELTAWHRPRLEVLLAAEPDVLALETIPDSDEAEALVALVGEYRMPAWLSYTIDGDRTRAGQPLEQAFAITAGVPEIVAVGVNCCAPADVLGAVATARNVTSSRWSSTPTAERCGTVKTACGSARRDSTPAWQPIGSPPEPGSSVAAAGCGPTTSPRLRRQSVCS